MEDVKFGGPQECPVCKTLNPAGMVLPEECIKCTLPLMKKLEPMAEVSCSAGLSCAGCELANSLLLSILNAARSRLITTTNPEHDAILDEIEAHLKSIDVI